MGQHATEKKVIRIGIAGFGLFGRHHLRAMLANSRFAVTCVADPGEVNPADLPHGTALFSSWQEMVAAPGLDAVSVCAPHHMHAPIAMAALRAGRHVLVEKPLALTVADGRALIDEAHRRRRVLMVELTHRFYPAVQQAREFVRTGNLGEIYAVEDRIVETAGEQLNAWLKTRALAGGGVALTNGVHMLDRIAFVTGQALTFAQGRAGYGGRLGDIEDTAAMLLTLENGAPVQFLASWPAGASGVDDELTIYGTKGTLRIYAWRGWRFDPLGDAPARDVNCFPDGEGVLARVQAGVGPALAEFAAAIDEARAPDPRAEAALEAQRLIEQFYTQIGLEPLPAGAGA